MQDRLGLQGILEPCLWSSKELAKPCDCLGKLTGMILMVIFSFLACRQIATSNGLCAHLQFRPERLPECRSCPSQL